MKAAFLLAVIACYMLVADGNPNVNDIPQDM
jgi:hypothetical protein